MSTLGIRTKNGAADTTNPVTAGGWTVKFEPADLAVRVKAEVYHIAVKGPAPSTFQIFVNSSFYSNVARGDINDWDPTQPLQFTPGDTIYFYYNVATTPRPTVSIYLREQSPI